MGDQSAIEWTDASWNPIVGCTKVSDGCKNCYPIPLAARLAHMGQTKYQGITTGFGMKARWTGEVRFVEAALALPLRWKAPRRIFVNSMSDLFHEKVADEWIDRIFAVMAQSARHTYQILTKRPERMQAYSTTMADLSPRERSQRIIASVYRGHLAERLVLGNQDPNYVGPFDWPLPNVQLGVSVENQPTADERIPLLLQTPAAVRFLSVEPLLSYVGLEEHWLLPTINAVTRKQVAPRIDWIIVGGESGPGARPCDLAWIRSVVAQATAAGVPVFVKQLGARPQFYSGPNLIDLKLRDRKGGDPAEFPSDLQVREFPR